ncbi:MAG: hypothetical protein AB8G11_15105 [Saprospiraceae bacterium]
MKNIYLIVAAILLMTINVTAQNINPSNGGYENRRIINKKKFHVLYEEVAIDKTVDEVWNEVAGNFVNVSEIVKSVKSSEGISGNLTTGLGATRQCELDFQGKTVELKEQIIDFKECGDYRAFTYDVYESKGFPAKTYNTWVVRKGEDGKTYLGTVFIFRANIGIATGIMEKQLKKTGLRTGILSYKHYLETGEKKVSAEKLEELYPSE